MAIMWSDYITDFMFSHSKSSFVRLQLYYNWMNLCLIKITKYNYNRRCRTIIDSIMQITKKGDFNSVSLKITYCKGPFKYHVITKEKWVLE